MTTWGMRNATFKMKLHSLDIISGYWQLRRQRSLPCLILLYWLHSLSSGLGDITQQLNQSELAVLLNLLQSQTDLSIPQMVQLLNIHSNPEIQQQLEALNQSISALTEASSQQQDSEPMGPEEAPPASVVQPSAEQTTPEASSTPADMQNMLAVLLSQLMKTQEPAGGLEENNSDKNSGPQGPRRTPTMPQEEAAGKQTGHESHWAQVLLILLKISLTFFFFHINGLSFSFSIT